MKRGYLQIYTGNGKGKTTAALGLALRAAGHGLQTFLLQFMKDYPYSELVALQLLRKWITVERHGNDDFVLRRQQPSEADLATARHALHQGREALLSGNYDVVIFDEIFPALYFGLLQAEEVLPLLDEKPESVELILTGRYCPPEFMAKADLVTEMREVKHYYQRGVLARKGIES